MKSTSGLFLRVHDRHRPGIAVANRHPAVRLAGIVIDTVSAPHAEHFIVVVKIQLSGNDVDKFFVTFMLEEELVIPLLVFELNQKRLHMFVAQPLGQRVVDVRPYHFI